MPRFLPFLVALSLFVFAAHTADARTATARKGDGIYQLLKRNGLTGKTHFEEFVRLNQANLGPKNTLYQRRVYELPDAGSNTMREPLFGQSPPKHQTRRQCASRLRLLPR